MMNDEMLRVMLGFERWAMGQVLEVCEGLPDVAAEALPGGTLPGGFDRRFEIGAGSLHDTVTHIVGAMRAWTETLAEVEPTPRLEADGQRRTPGELRVLDEQAWEAFAAEAQRRPLGETVTRRLRDGRSVTMTRGEVIAQVVTHGVHHRAQCLNMLRQLGVSPLPPASVAEWTWRGAKQ